MTNRLKIEVFSAGCPLCEDAVGLVKDVAGAAHDVRVSGMDEASVSRRARALGVRSVPAVVVGGELADCCAGGGISERALQRSLEEPLREEGGEDSAPRPKKGCC